MAELKTKPTGASVAAFIAGLSDPDRRRDCRTLMAMMRRATGVAPRMWGPSIVGYGQYHYKYASGREGDWFLLGFSPRKQDLTVYITSGVSNHGDLLAKLGRHKTGVSCLYLKSLAAIDLAVLERIVTQSVARMKKPSS